MRSRPGTRLHTFVDENKARGLMAAASCPAPSVKSNRKATAGLLRAGQRRIHFQKESPARQRKILAAITELDFTVRLYAASRADVDSGHTCLIAIVRDAARATERLVVERESRPSTSTARSAIAPSARTAASTGCSTSCSHRAWIRCCWVPDAVVWAWAKGGEWREQIREYCELEPL